MFWNCNCNPVILYWVFNSGLVYTCKCMGVHDTDYDFVYLNSFFSENEGFPPHTVATFWLLPGKFLQLKPNQVKKKGNPIQIQQNKTKTWQACKKRVFKFAAFQKCKLGTLFQPIASLEMGDSCTFCKPAACACLQLAKVASRGFFCMPAACFCRTACKPIGTASTYSGCRTLIWWACM